MRVSIFSPAKLNLFLAVTGRRSDGYHDLVSLAAPLDFGDELEAEGGPGRDSVFTLACDDPGIPLDESNLVLKAARAFVAATGWEGGAAFRLTKRIPVGAGLGGGSSNAVAALRALNELAGRPLGGPALAGLAASLGSDCALFLEDSPVVMRGRGERIERLAPSAAARLRQTAVILFKPGFGIGTPWAYGRLAARRTDYVDAAEAEARLARWLEGDSGPAELVFNSLTGPAFEKYPAVPLLLAKLRDEFGVAAGMSGSGSACFALAGGAVTEGITARIRECWGPRAFVRPAFLL